uniref:Odorant receptor n=1 Tax=Bombyx mandarina TaxID=7092 RepID=C7E3W0_BOMMA|nr:olfactory-receptor 3 [Bombyx mandarina]
MIFVDDAVIGIKDPREYRHLRVLRTSLRLLGAWPGHYLGEETGSKYECAPMFLLMFIKIACLYLTIVYLRNNADVLGFFELGHVYLTIFMTFVTLSRGFSLTWNPNYHKVVKKFITEMHLLYFKDNSEYAMKTHRRVHKISHFYTVFLKVQMIAGLTLFNVIPMYNNYRQGNYASDRPANITYDLSIYYETFDILNTPNGYTFICVFNWFASYICCSFFCSFDLILSLMISTVSGHFRILIHNLLTFPLPEAITASKKFVDKHRCNGNRSEFVLEEAKLYSPAEMWQVTDRLRQCIDYHRKLVEFTGDISEAFGPMLFVYYLFHQVSGCLLLLECSQLNTAALVRYGVLTVVLYQQLIQLSVIVESVGTVTGRLKDAVYEVPWEYMDTSNRKTVAIFLMNVQEPLHVNALGLAKVGVQSMAAILKTSFSYFTFLRTVSE